MLLNFTVSNFCSFFERATFSMEGGRARGKREHLFVSRYARSLKFAAIYGANAAGKSNLVKSMHFARNVIVNDGRIPSGYTTSYNRTAAENANRPSTFEFEVLLGKKRFVYGFDIVLSKRLFTKEWLYDNTSDSKILFVRSFDGNSIFNLPVKGTAETRIGIYFNDIATDSETLFLREINRKKESLYEEIESIGFLRELHNWFLHKLVFIYPSEIDVRRYGFTFNASKPELFNTLHRFSLDITDYKFEDTSVDKVFDMIPEELRDTIMDDIEKTLAKQQQNPDNQQGGMYFFNGEDLCLINIDNTGKQTVQIVKLQHGTLGEYLLSEESDGTRRILELVEVLLSRDRGITYIIDEVDRSLHPLLTEAFITEYLNTVSDRQSQLVVTTHESRLLGTNRLRRDEIWFVDKKDGKTDIWRFDQMEDTEHTGTLARGDIRVETAYLSGRYGGIPELIIQMDECNL